jgi:hypothetical protein
MELGRFGASKQVVWKVQGRSTIQDTPTPSTTKPRRKFMAIITGEDLRRLVESRHDARACDPSKLSASPQWQQSLAASCEALTQGHEALRRAALHAHVETQESDSARIGRASAVEAAGRQYRYVYQKARLALATDDPEDPMPEELLAERTKQFEQTFAAVPSSLEGLGSERAAEFLDQGARLLKTFDPDEFGDLVRRLEQAAQRLHAANDQWRREVSEDRAATDALDRFAVEMISPPLTRPPSPPFGRPEGSLPPP